MSSVPSSFWTGSHEEIRLELRGSLPVCKYCFMRFAPAQLSQGCFCSEASDSPALPASARDGLRFRASRKAVMISYRRPCSRLGPQEVAERTHPCLQRGGRLLYMPGQDDPGWYRCKHLKLCGSRMSAYPACGIGLPIPNNETGNHRCSECGAEQPACPTCQNGWLIERRGRYGAFFGCVRFPDCSGKAKLRKRA